MSARGRPRTFDRDRALHAAMLLFWEKGYSATSISELCTAMEIGSPSLYAAFRSKESLFAEAIDRFGQTVSPAIWHTLSEDVPVREAVEQFLLNSAEVLTAAHQPRGCMVSLSAVGNEGCESLGRLVRDIRQSALAVIERRLCRAVAEGELAQDTDVNALAMFICGVQQGMSIQARDGASKQSLQSMAKAAMIGWPTN